MTLCKHCGEPLKFTPCFVQCMQWVHAHGYYGCNKECPSHSETYAEPPDQTKFVQEATDDPQ